MGRGPPPPRPGDPAPVVGPSHPPHHSRLARLVLPRHPPCSPAGGPDSHPRPPRRLVPEVASGTHGSGCFSAARALVRRELWAREGFALSARDPDIVKLPRKFVDHLTETLGYAA